MDTALTKALETVQNACTTYGILASATEETNYRRVWARDSAVCGLAGLLLQDDTITTALARSIITLADAQGPQGQIPSNVAIALDGSRSISLGGLAGRVDTITWWAIALAQYTRFTGDYSLWQLYQNQIERGFALMDAWEFNARGLVYTPLAGNWADEYVLQGYTLYDQVLRYWALKCCASLSGRADWSRKADLVKDLIRDNFFILEESRHPYHPHAYQLAQKSNPLPDYPLAAFSPAGYFHLFDAWGCSLLVLSGLCTQEEVEAIILHGHGLMDQQSLRLIPAFWPVIDSEHELWPSLRANFRFEFRNQPHDFHNGGLWPMVNGWWALAQRKAGHSKEADRTLEATAAACALEDWGFYECVHGITGKATGNKTCTWSAAGLLLAHTQDSLWFPT